MGRVLGTALRAAAGSGPGRRRPLRRPLIEEQFELAGRTLTLLRPPSADELIDESAFDEEEFLPYWAELWPSGVALARYVETLELEDRRVVELGAGLGLPSLAASLRGAHVLATDWAGDAVALLRANAERNHVRLRVERIRWDEPGGLLAEAPFDLVLGADLLYESRNAAQLLELLPELGGEIVIADPGRPFAKGFLGHFEVETPADGVYRLGLR